MAGPWPGAQVHGAGDSVADEEACAPRGHTVRSAASQCTRADVQVGPYIV